MSFIALAAGVLAGATAPAAAGFVPHRAQYAFSLVSAKPGTGISAVEGDLITDWDGSCEGWTLNQKSVLAIYAPSGKLRLSLSSSVTTWESADGREYRFNVRNQSDGKAPEQIEGKARIPSAKAAGWVDFVSPRRGRVPLPAGTVFPTRHTIVVLEALPRAPTLVSRVVFDGLTLDGLHEINAVIGKPQQPPSGTAAERRTWPVRLAFFGVGSAKAEPEHEMGLTLTDDGVARDMVIDFDEFVVRAKLTRLEMGRVEPCP